MKILFISHSSVIHTYRDKLKFLARKKGVELILLLPSAWPEAGRRIVTHDQEPNLEGFRILSRPIRLEGRLKRHFYPDFPAVIEELNPDIIHIEEEPYSLVAWQAARAAKKINAQLIFFTWENLLEKFGFPHQWIRQYVLNTADHAIAGDKEASQLLQKAGFASSRISVIPQYGVNPILFRKKNSIKLRKRLKLGPFTVGYVGRLVPEKGIQTLLESFAKVKGIHNSLLILGSGPLMRSLQSQSVELGIEKQVRWVSALEQTSVPDYLNCMDALVLPSLTTPRWKEQFGRVLIEAQACEVPVIGSDSGAIPEVIDKAGLIFREGDVEQLANRIKSLMDSKTLCGKLGKTGRKRVLDHYTNQKIADSIFRIYQNLKSKS
jgi:glycosyltransferase involved in cell wall biosynthesis